jgi:septal ring factor EnvC (AmiA/AmiB activator)
VRIQPRQATDRLILLVVSALLGLGAVGCGAMFTGNPRYARGKAPPKPKPKPAVAKPLTNPVGDKRRGMLPWPAQGPVVTQFGTIVDPKYGTATKSSGIDIATNNGSPVLAVDSGKVSFADMFLGYGRMVILDHGNRSHSIYSKLSDVKVKVGAIVTKGQTIALSGDTLHFEFRVGGKSVDPLDWLVPLR